MNETLEQMRRIEEQIRELVNGLDWLDEPLGFYGEDELDERDVGAKGRADG
ncbi:MAG: hypothetical protein ACTHJ3_05120 [Pararhizobium sp.]